MQNPSEASLDSDEYCVCLFFYTSSIFWTGTDENAIIELLGSRTNKQRVPMVAAYKTTYGKVCFVILCTDFFFYSWNFFCNVFLLIEPPHDHYMYADFALFFFFSILEFNPWSEVWAHWTLWEAGPCSVDEPLTLWCDWTQRGDTGRNSQVVVSAAASILAL